MECRKLFPTISTWSRLEQPISRTFSIHGPTAVTISTSLLPVQSTQQRDSECTASVVERLMLPRLSPAITITSPGQGDTVTGTINVEVSVSDNVGVVKSQLYVDNVLVVSSTTAPFTLKWNTRKLKSGQHVLKSKAFDAAGNAGTSESITVIK